MTEVAVCFKQVTFGYTDVPVLENVDFDIPLNEFVWIVGPNGGGKTTLMKLMLGLLRPSSGSITVLGRSPESSRSRVGYMPQHSNTDPRFPVTAMDVVLMGRLGQGRPFGRYSRADRVAAEKALEDVGLTEAATTPLARLSGGQQRRVLIARALSCEPELLLLDEPTANLDMKVAREFYALLNRLSERLTIAMVSHEPAFVSEFVKSVVCVNRSVSIHPTAEVDSRFLGEIHRGEVRMVRHDRHVEGGEHDHG